MMNLTYCFDLDGTLCTQVDPKNHGMASSVEETYRAAKPLRDRIAAVNRLYEKGNYIYIDTARASTYPDQLEQWKKMTREQLKEWGVKYHKLKFGKPIYDLFIDDKNINSNTFFKEVSK